MAYSHWLCPGPVQIGCIVLCRTFHTAPEQRQGPEQGQGQGRMGYVPIFQVLKLFQVTCFNCISMAFRCLALVPDTPSVNGFCITLVPVPQGSVHTNRDRDRLKNGLYRIVWRCSYCTETPMSLGTVVIMSVSVSLSVSVSVSV